MSVSQAGACLSAQEAGVLALLLPYLAVTAVDRAVVSGDLVIIWVRAAAGGAACPGCGTWCTKVRGRYSRRLRDAAAGGRRVLIWLVVRLLRCGNPDCPKGSSAGLAVPYARKTPLLAGQLGAVAAALAGRAGSRLARVVLAAGVSRDTLIRLLMAVPDPPAGAVRVLGADLSRSRDYPDCWCGDVVDAVAAGGLVAVRGAAWIGIITSSRGRRAAGRAGGSGRA